MFLQLCFVDSVPPALILGWETKYFPNWDVQQIDLDEKEGYLLPKLLQLSYY